MASSVQTFKINFVFLSQHKAPLLLSIFQKWKMTCLWCLNVICTRVLPVVSCPVEFWWMLQKWAKIQRSTAVWMPDNVIGFIVTQTMCEYNWILHSCGEWEPYLVAMVTHKKQKGACKIQGEPNQYVQVCTNECIFHFMFDLFAIRHRVTVETVDPLKQLLVSQRSWIVVWHYLLFLGSCVYNFVGLYACLHGDY